jgi:hypothetical protein
MTILHSYSIRTYANKPGFDSKSLFLTHKYLRETGFAEFACVSPEHDRSFTAQ